MNRRDLLKHTGALALGLPALRASAAAALVPQAGVRELIVPFRGPFCFWVEGANIRVMAPPVGTGYEPAPHQAFIATSRNETQLNSQLGATSTCYNLNLGPRPPSPLSFAGTPALTFPQQEYLGANPLFNLTLPVPDKIIGVNPTCVTIDYRQQSPLTGHLPRRNGGGGPDTYASSLTFVYNSVDLSQVELVEVPCQGQKQPPEQFQFKPCFDNDADLPAAFLGIHLTKLDQRPDKDHIHARYVWSQMLSMYPWLLASIAGITFQGFNPAECQCPSVLPQTGPGDDCEVPIMVLG